jgi:hypothetical protein
MRLFKIILVFFAIYFIRRFWQFYKAVEQRGREINEEEATNQMKPQEDTSKIVEAEYKKID